MPINNITQTISELPAAGKRGIDVQTIFVTKQEDFQDHLQGTTVTELNTLKDQLNSRIGEINSTTTTMNGYANTASAGASTATTKAGEASTSASEALTSKNQAGTFATNSSNSATKASQWADNNYNVEVETGKYSAKHWATEASNILASKVSLNGDEVIAGVKTFSSSPIVPTPTADFQTATKEYVDSKPTLPIGAILNGYTILDNCIVAFGGEFSRADYPKLWAYLQANPTLVKTQAQWTTENNTNGMCGFFSDGNGTTTFRVPNLDKAFLRPDSRSIASYQGDAIRNITGSFRARGAGSSGTGVFTATVDLETYTGNGSGNSGTVSLDASLSVPTSNENRPKNIAVLPLIVAR